MTSTAHPDSSSKSVYIMHCKTSQVISSNLQDQVKHGKIVSKNVISDPSFYSVKQNTYRTSYFRKIWKNF